MKKFTLIILSLILICTCFAGCGKKDGTTESPRLMFNYDMSEYVTLDSYKILVDKQSEEYLDYFHAKLRLMMTTKLTNGSVEDGDTVNIDYVGKKDGVAFNGGTANGYDLTIGSNKFIAGFESGLIGKEIGSTVELNLTFPENYSDTSLAGQAVVFTVKINYASRSFDRVNNDTAVKCGYKDAYEVMNLGHEYAIENYAWDMVYKSAQFADMPKREIRILYKAEMSSYEAIAAQYNLTVEQLITYYGYTSMEQLENELNNETIPERARTYALSYYILDKEGKKVTSEQLEAVRKELEEELGISLKDAGITDSYVEAEAARKLAIQIVFDSVTVKDAEESQ